METIKGTKIPNMGSSLNYEGDLLFHDGPLLSHFINKKNPSEHFFYKWADFNDDFNRWLVFKVEEEDISSFFQKEVSLLELINKKSFIFIVDLDNNLDPSSVVISSIQDIPDDYLPSERSYYKEEQYEKYAELLKDKILNKETSSINKLFTKLIEEIATIKKTQNEQADLLNTIKVNLET